MSIRFITLSVSVLLQVLPTVPSAISARIPVAVLPHPCIHIKSYIPETGRHGIVHPCWVSSKCTSYPINSFPITRRAYRKSHTPYTRLTRFFFASDIASFHSSMGFTFGRKCRAREICYQQMVANRGFVAVIVSAADALSAAVPTL